jgi:GT2 family glycosyltransferase
MISIAVLTHQARPFAANCLSSLLGSVKSLGMENAVEYILIDDCSDPAIGMMDLFQEVRRSTTANVQIIRFKKHQHYAYGVALAFSLARGENVLFFSHDMIIPPSCLQVLLHIAAADASFGILRCRSRHMDFNPELQLIPPVPMQAYQHVNAFGESAAKYFGGLVTETGLLIGDSMLVKRAVIDRIGVFDTRFFGLMADIDYGLRAQRAGFKHGVPLGAWLHHEGEVVTKQILAAGGPNPASNIHGPYKVFREKWDPTLPENFFELGSVDRLLNLRTNNRLTPEQFFQPPLAIDPQVCEVF